MPRVALVCAASKGLGRASAEALARDGFHVAICARGGEALEATADAIRRAGGDVLSIQADVSRAKTWNASCPPRSTGSAASTCS